MPLSHFSNGILDLRSRCTTTREDCLFAVCHLLISTRANCDWQLWVVALGVVWWGGVLGVLWSGLMGGLLVEVRGVGWVFGGFLCGFVGRFVGGGGRRRGLMNVWVCERGDGVCWVCWF